MQGPSQAFTMLFFSILARNHLEERARVDRGPPVPRNPRGRTGARSPTACRFQHNWRLWVLGGPCFGVLLLLGGRPTVLVAALGNMTCYCFDLSGNTVRIDLIITFLLPGCELSEHRVCFRVSSL